MFVKVIGWINLAIWAISGILILTCNFENFKSKKHLKVVYGLTWFALMWNLLARILEL